MEAMCRHLKNSFPLKLRLGVGERQDFRGTLDSDCLVHSLALLLINARLQASYVTSVGLSVSICNMGMMVVSS